MNMNKAQLVVYIGHLRAMIRQLQAAAAKGENPVASAVAGVVKRPGEHAAAAVWRVFRVHGLTFQDLMEMAGCIVRNVADKTGSSDKDLLEWLGKVIVKQRAKTGRNISNVKR